VRSKKLAGVSSNGGFLVLSIATLYDDERLTSTVAVVSSEIDLEITPHIPTLANLAEMFRFE
jgi:hypothetical protein